MKSDKGAALYEMAIFGVVMVLIIGVAIYTLLQSDVFIHPEDTQNVLSNTSVSKSI